jgi:hypothetical protein
MGFVNSQAGETLGYACFVTGSTPQDVLNMTDTEREVAAKSGMAMVRSVLEAYGSMWDS